jgi:hypothetical protein
MIMSELNRDEIEKMYNSGISIRKLGSIFHCSDRTMRNFMKENNISIQKRNLEEISEDVALSITSLYFDGLNPRQIGEIVELPASKVKSYLVSNDIWIGKESFTKEEITNLYVVKKMSIREIADLKNCSIKKVQLALSRFDVEKPQYTFNYKELYLLYSKYHFTIQEIAKVKNTSDWYVKKALKSYAIA